MTTSDRNMANLRRAGLRITQPRTLVLSVLSMVRHISAEGVYKILLDRGDEASLASIYRVLADLEQAGLIERQSFQGTYAVYEMSTKEHHDHLVCLDCGRVVEFMDPMIERRQEEIAAEHDLKIADHTMHLFGRCTRKDCEHSEEK